MFLPNVDVFEQPGELVILVDMPGVARNDVQISWKDQVLTIVGQKRQECDPRARFNCAERNYGPFRREIAVGVPVDHRRATADLRDGLMRIHLPKRADADGPSSIPIGTP
jgi:HSP20 family protein